MLEWWYRAKNFWDWRSSRPRSAPHSLPLNASPTASARCVQSMTCKQRRVGGARQVGQPRPPLCAERHRTPIMFYYQEMKASCAHSAAGHLQKVLPLECGRRAEQHADASRHLLPDQAPPRQQPRVHALRARGAAEASASGGVQLLRLALAGRAAVLFPQNPAAPAARRPIRPRHWPAPPPPPARWRCRAVGGEAVGGCVGQHTRVSRLLRRPGMADEAGAGSPCLPAQPHPGHRPPHLQLQDRPPRHRRVCLAAAAPRRLQTRDRLWLLRQRMLAQRLLLLLRLCRRRRASTLSGRTAVAAQALVQLAAHGLQPCEVGLVPLQRRFVPAHLQAVAQGGGESAWQAGTGAGHLFCKPPACRHQPASGHSQPRTSDILSTPCGSVRPGCRKKP